MRNTFPHGRVANPSRTSGRVTVSQDALHIADFAANPTARHCLEVRAVSQGLRPKFLWKRRMKERVRAVGGTRAGGRSEGKQSEVPHELGKPSVTRFSVGCQPESPG